MSNAEEQWPILFNGVGALTLFTHNALLDPTVTLVLQPLRRIPLSLLEEVTKDLRKPLEDGFMEPVEASSWVFNLVIAK